MLTCSLEFCGTEAKLNRRHYDVGIFKCYTAPLSDLPEPVEVRLT